MRKRAKYSRGGTKIDVAKARQVARELRKRRGGKLKPISRSDRERILGHFGPRVSHAGRKRGGKKVAKKRAA